MISCQDGHASQPCLPSAAEQTTSCALVLAHVNNDRVEAAYRCSDLFGYRRTLMQRLADCLAAST